MTVDPDGMWMSLIAKKNENTPKNAKNPTPYWKPKEY